MSIKSGDVVHVSRAASVQFVSRPIDFRIIRVHDDPVGIRGWAWLDGYELDATGKAVERRSIFVLTAGLTPISKRRTL